MLNTEHTCWYDTRFRRLPRGPSSAYSHWAVGAALQLCAAADGGEISLRETKHPALFPGGQIASDHVPKPVDLRRELFAQCQEELRIDGVARCNSGVQQNQLSPPSASRLGREERANDVFQDARRL